MRKLLNRFKSITNRNINENYGGEIRMLADRYKDTINDIRKGYEQSGDYEWHRDSYVLDAEYELAQLGFYYDDETWDIAPDNSWE